MQPIEPATFQPPVNRILPKTKREQLPPPNHPILPLSEPRNLVVRRPNLQFPASYAGNDKFVGAVCWHTRQGGWCRRADGALGVTFV
jgi:hypothetical protein